MKFMLPRMKLAENIPGADRFNRWVDQIIGAIENLHNISASGILSATIGPNGIHLHVPEFPIAIVKTTGTISARVGATPGTGTVTFQMFNLTSFVDDSARTNLTVYNYSSNATLTTSGKYGVCIKIWGVWFLIVVEC